VVYYGARQCPRDSVVRALIDRLSRPLRKHHIADFFEYHNLYTAYVIAAQALGLAFRGVISPAVNDWVPQGDIVTFSDKVRSDYHRRVSYLPPVIVRLLLNYGEHRAYARRHFPEHLELQRNDSIFVLWGAGKQEFRPFHPSDFDAYSGNYGLPVRSLRHYMRTRLVRDIVDPAHRAKRLDRDLTVEVVDAWMGHWHLGLSPRESGSTFNPQLLQRLANGPVANILRKLQVKAYTSRYVDYG
jgi:hypothetical protein